MLVKSSQSTAVGCHSTSFLMPSLWQYSASATHSQKPAPVCQAGGSPAAAAPQLEGSSLCPLWGRKLLLCMGDRWRVTPQEAPHCGHGSGCGGWSQTWSPLLHLQQFTHIPVLFYSLLQAVLGNTRVYGQ